MAASAKKSAAGKASTKQVFTKQPSASQATAKRTSRDSGRGKLRVRMYRVGFGDFFLVTIPTVDGPRHILIDCGVHAGNIKSMPDCVQDLVVVTGRKLALVIVTHYHADHLSGFATQSEAFEQFEVETVWITNRLDPSDRQAMELKSQIAELSMHLQLQLQLSARDDAEGVQALNKVENALGAAGSGNEKALSLVTTGFKNSPPVYYYEAGDTPTLPESLRGALTARILGPAPKASGGEFSASDNKAEQYLAAVRQKGMPEAERFKPFDREWPATVSDYPPEAFRPWKTVSEMEATLHAVQPDVLAAAADAIDGTLNNQSLVVLFTCRGKKLLFVGDAQWGNWAYWLYGKAVKGKDPGISEEARQILSSIDFYKVGHHGSTNATPIPAVSAMSHRCVAMCSTETGYPSLLRTYGKIASGTEVPRIPLMEALETQTGRRLVRSDWIAAGNAEFSPEAHEQLDRLPPDFETGSLYIEYVFPE